MAAISTLDFNDFEWHDAIIHNIVIDREHPGDIDTISMTITWPADTKGELIFENVWEAKLDMNFRVVASESIFMASATFDNPAIEDVLRKWSKMPQPLPPLFCYAINTNSTYSNIKIVAEKFTVKFF